MDWSKHLSAHVNFAKEKFGDKYFVACVAAKGSQNYNLDDETSDFDSVCLVVPYMGTLMTELQPLSTTLMLPNREQCKVKDLRVFCKEFMKSWSLWEVITTDLSYWAAAAVPFRNFMRAYLDEFAHVNEYTVARSILGEATREYKNTQIAPGEERKNKSKMKVLRFNLMMRKFLAQAPAIDMLTCDDTDREMLLAAKHGKLKNVDRKVENAMREMEEMLELMPLNNKEQEAELYERMVKKCGWVYKYVMGV